jgi:hypothetical protein
MGELSSDSGTRSQLRQRSKRLLGNADRLEVAVAVARSSDGMVHATELSNELGISTPRVRAQLLAFTEAGVMNLLGRQGQSVWYQRLPDPFWDAALTLHEAWS